MNHSPNLGWVAMLLIAVVILGVRETARPGIDEPTLHAGVQTRSPMPEQPMPTAALSLAFGFSAPGEPASSQTGLVLKACMVPSRGEARALVASGNGERVYRIGDRLPGGSVLRRIDVRSITLWVGGREETLLLSAAHATLFHPSGGTATSGRAAADSPRLLREVQ
ncbi:type II secretion system protein N [Pseudomonas sp. NPDC012596]|uniref:type II secretion system protein N n=1 Tax=Pseudomonas sp. NPDC012596 TaxID=3364419 RepID=UPI0036A3C84D